jgi:hypothetical protein
MNSFMNLEIGRFWGFGSRMRVGSGLGGANDSHGVYEAFCPPGRPTLFLTESVDFPKVDLIGGCSNHRRQITLVRLEATLAVGRYRSSWVLP